MDTWTILRLLKFLSVALFAGGVLLSTGARARADRLDAAWTLAPLGFLGAWLSGYGMMKATGVSMGAGWISGSMLASIAALQLSQLGARSVLRQRWLAVPAWGCLGGSVGAMVGRLAGEGWSGVAALGAILCAGAALACVPSMAAPDPETPGPEADRRVMRGFWAWSRLEAASAIALFVVYMPLKYGAGIVLDGGQGWFGWVHGALTVLYLNNLPAARRAGGWSLPVTALAFASSLVPFGALAFERWARREQV